MSAFTAGQAQRHCCPLFGRAHERRKRMPVPGTGCGNRSGLSSSRTGRPSAGRSRASLAGRTVSARPRRTAAAPATPGRPRPRPCTGIFRAGQPPGFSHARAGRQGLASGRKDRRDGQLSRLSGIAASLARLRESKAALWLCWETRKRCDGKRHDRARWNDQRGVHSRL